MSGPGESQLGGEETGCAEGRAGRSWLSWKKGRLSKSKLLVDQRLGEVATAGAEARDDGWGHSDGH